MKKIIDCLKTPFRYKVATRLNRLQNLTLQITAITPFLSFTFTVVFLCMILGVNLNQGFLRVLYFIVDVTTVLFWIILSLIGSVSRLHDCNYSGWWILLINALSRLLIFPILLLLVWRGSKEENKYGKPSYSIWVLKK